jgi:hypothetical protein
MIPGIDLIGRHIARTWVIWTMRGFPFLRPKHSWWSLDKSVHTSMSDCRFKFDNASRIGTMSSDELSINSNRPRTTVYIPEEWKNKSGQCFPWETEIQMTYFKSRLFTLCSESGTISGKLVMISRWIVTDDTPMTYEHDAALGYLSTYEILLFKYIKRTMPEVSSTSSNLAESCVGSMMLFNHLICCKISLGVGDSFSLNISSRRGMSV